MLSHWTYLLVPILYFAITLGLGLYAGRRGGNSITDYFLQGRSAPWWLAGTSMVATTFAADTPLAVTLLTAENGIAGNWVWWSMAIGGMFTVFFFARLWGRAHVLTDLEFIELRYSGHAAVFLRGFKAVYFGLVINVMVIGWVHLAMARIIQVMLPEVSPVVGVTALSLFTVAYVGYTGLRGVTVTDAFQFLVAMIGSILLAIYAVNSAPVVGAGGLISALPDNVFHFFPTVSSEASSDTGYALTVLSFFTFIAVQWWASWYPGAEPGGGGYIAQRIMSARSEEDGFFATLWFVIAHYAVRPWPWILAALATLVVYPSLEGAQREASYIALIRDQLPGPLQGLLFAAFAGAYMSTISTQLNWGSSYLLNDLYLRFAETSGEEQKRVRAARVITFVLLAISLVVTFTVLETVKDTWTLLLEFGAGTGSVLILRWYWWRINAATEIASMVAPALGTIFLHTVAPPVIQASVGSEMQSLALLMQFPGSLLFNTTLALAAVFLTTALTRPDATETLEAFYRRVRPAGPGWKRFREKTGVESKDRPVFMLMGWLSSTIMVYSGLFLAGKLLLAIDTQQAMVYGIVFLVSLLLSVFAIRRMYNRSV